MKRWVVFSLIIAAILMVITPTLAIAGDTYVRGYYRKDGTYVQPHYRSKPDGNIWNNWSTKGNVNPYTGKRGTVDPYKSYRTPRSYSTTPLYQPPKSFGNTNPYGSFGTNPYGNTNPYKSNPYNW